MFTSVQPQIADELAQIRAEGLFKNERVITSPQRAAIMVANGTPVLNMCANNYLGLADDPRIIGAAKDALNIWGYGMASVRFICGTQEVHKQLERRISVPRHRRHDLVLLVLRRQRRAVRDCAWRAGRGDQRRAQPRLHHRRSAIVQSPALPL